MIAQTTRQSPFSAIPALIRSLSNETSPPEHDVVHLAFEDLLILSLLCLFWGFVIYSALRWGL